MRQIVGAHCGNKEALGPIADINTGKFPFQISGAAKEPMTYPLTREGWKEFPRVVVRYDDGFVRGERLLIGDNAVMEEWERPVEEQTMQALWKRIPVFNPTILIGGEGLGYATQAAIKEARDHGGATIHIVELHPDVFADGKKRVEELLASIAPEQRNTIRIFWHEGDFKDVIADPEQFPDNSVDALRIDLYPLSPDEKDIDSFMHTDAILRIIKPHGVFAPFVGEEDRLLQKQLEWIDGRFNNREYFYVYVAPPADCTYFQGKRMLGAVFYAPIIPILQQAS